ncbi:protein-disulfide reductase DsbD family protein [Pelagerythrobacter sp.]|uniref:protein-disulfide reductase DsbD family protein n=1 Tax=Pelagerythrobacter sp. TaxID=2800702 RepID=UPI0035B00DAE
MGAVRAWLAYAALALVAALALAAAGFARAQPLIGDDNMSAELIAEKAPEAGGEWMLALRFTPRSDEWHGYWSNPGDAGLGMELDWTLPAGWSAGEPLYPVPHRLVIGGLMNHVYEGRYTVLVPIRIPRGADIADAEPLEVTADYLACTDKLCVPQQAVLELDPAELAEAEPDPRFVKWRAQIAPLIESRASFAVDGQTLRVAVPLPAEVALPDPHLFVSERELGQGKRPAYAQKQSFFRDGDRLVVDVPLTQLNLPSDLVREPAPPRIEGILAFSRDVGVRFSAEPGKVAEAGVPIAQPQLPSLWLLALGALAGGLFLNVMPCVFPILSLKALSLARAGESAALARREGAAYTAGVVLACLALGAGLLALRSAGESVGWAFQLQQPAVVVGLLALTAAITANLAGLFELPSISLTRSGEPAGAFATGLLAAFIATPCTGPFMAAALGAALVLPTSSALLLFGAMGVGLALPFLAIGFVPPLRRMLPRPGPWMETFRKVMAVPMGLTALALLWLCFRLGGDDLGWGAAAMLGALAAILLVVGRTAGAVRSAAVVSALAAVIVAVAVLPRLASDEIVAAESILEPAEFSEAELAEARADGDPVFVWFTADWCVTCKVNESVAIERKPTRNAFADAGVVAMRGDWTRRDPAITRFLADHGAAGVPLYLWYAPGEEARQLPQVLGPDALITLAQSLPARRETGGRAGTPRPEGAAAGSD